MNKNKKIIKLVNLVNNTFGDDAPIINDHWEMDLCAIGLQKGSKLIYVSATGCKNNHYFYECEALLDNPDVPYVVQDSKDNVPEEQLLDIMSKFFEIERKNQLLPKEHV